MLGKESTKVDDAAIMETGPVGITEQCHYIHCTTDLFTSSIHQNDANWV